MTISIISLTIITFVFKTSVTSGSDVGCMNAFATFFTNNLPESSQEIIKYLDPQQIADGLLAPCPAENPLESCCNKCTLPDKGDQMCCKNHVCPCLKLKNEGTCEKLTRPFIFNQQFFTVNASCHGVYINWSIFNKTGDTDSKDEQEFTILPVLDTTAPTIPLLNKYIYATGFGAKFIDDYYVTFYAHFRICVGTLVKLLNINLNLRRALKTDDILDDLIGLDDCKCELEKPFTSESFYMAKDQEFKLDADTTLFTLISENADNSVSFNPESAKNRQKKCSDSRECTTLTCTDQALVKCCVSGICKCVSNPDKTTCLPCSRNGVFVGEMKHCGSLGQKYLDYYSIYKTDGGCNENEPNDIPFTATLVPADSQDLPTGATVVIGNLVHSTPSFQFTWYGKLVLTQETINRIKCYLEEGDKCIPDIGFNKC